MSATRSIFASVALLASLLVACSAKTDNPPTSTQGGTAPGAGGGVGGGSGGSGSSSGGSGSDDAATAVTSDGAPVCNSTSCTQGCCSQGVCVGGTTPAACGTGGNVCTVCNSTLSQQCVGNECE